MKLIYCFGFIIIEFILTMSLFAQDEIRLNYVSYIKDDYSAQYFKGLHIDSRYIEMILDDFSASDSLDMYKNLDWQIKNRINVEISDALNSAALLVRVYSEQISNNSFPSPKIWLSDHSLPLSEVSKVIEIKNINGIEKCYKITPKFIIRFNNFIEYTEYNGTFENNFKPGKDLKELILKEPWRVVMYAIEKH